MGAVLAFIVNQMAEMPQVLLVGLLIGLSVLAFGLLGPLVSGIKLGKAGRMLERMDHSEVVVLRSHDAAQAIAAPMRGRPDFKEGKFTPPPDVAGSYGELSNPEARSAFRRLQDHRVIRPIAYPGTEVEYGLTDNGKAVTWLLREKTGSHGT